jgi:hypothetical protein
MKIYIYTKDNELKIASVCKQNKPDMVEHIVVAESLEKAIEIFEKGSD